MTNDTFPPFFVDEIENENADPADTFAKSVFTGPELAAAADRSKRRKAEAWASIPAPREETTWEDMENIVKQHVAVVHGFKSVSVPWFHHDDTADETRSKESRLLRSVLETQIYVDKGFDPTDRKQKHCFLELPAYLHDLDLPNLTRLQRLRFIRLTRGGADMNGAYPIDFERGKDSGLQIWIAHLSGKDWFVQGGFAPILMMVHRYLTVSGFFKRSNRKPA